MARKAEEAAKGMLWPSVLFEEFGLRYYGPVDGHDIGELIRIFQFLKTLDRPVLLHVLTQKGRGFEPAEEMQKKFHGLGPYDPRPVRPRRSASAPTPRYLPTPRRNSPRPMTASWPSRPPCPTAPRSTVSAPFILASILTSASPKNTPCYSPPDWPRAHEALRRHLQHVLQRGFDQIVHDVCLQNLPVVFCMDRGGLSGDDGPTHHGLFDISYLRGIPTSST